MIQRFHLPYSIAIVGPVVVMGLTSCAKPPAASRHVAQIQFQPIEQWKSPWPASSFSEIVPAPGQICCTPYSINDSGDIVGQSSVITSETVTTHGFILQRGSYKTVDFPKANKETTLVNIDNEGTITGYYRDTKDIDHWFHVRGNKFKEIQFPYRHLHPPGRLSITAPFHTTSRNADGIIVGTYSVPLPDAVYDRHFGFKFLHGKYFTIHGPTGANDVGANGINNKGEIVGDFFDSKHCGHGYVLTHGKYQEFDDPNVVLDGHTIGTFALGINNRGAIVGVYEDGVGMYHGFLLNRPT